MFSSACLLRLPPKPALRQHNTDGFFVAFFLPIDDHVDGDGGEGVAVRLEGGELVEEVLGKTEYGLAFVVEAGLAVVGEGVAAHQGGQDVLAVAEEVEPDVFVAEVEGERGGWLVGGVVLEEFDRRVMAVHSRPSGCKRLFAMRRRGLQRIEEAGVQVDDQVALGAGHGDVEEAVGFVGRGGVVVEEDVHGIELLAFGAVNGGDQEGGVGVMGTVADGVDTVLEVGFAQEDVEVGGVFTGGVGGLEVLQQGVAEVEFAAALVAMVEGAAGLLPGFVGD